MTTLTIKGPMYFSTGDEAAFFRWLENIPHVTSIHGELEYLHIDLRAGKLPDKSLRELIALLYRYRMDMTTLAQFASDKNSKWFCDPEMCWHQDVFVGRPRHPREGWDEASKDLMDEDINAIDDAWAQ